MASRSRDTSGEDFTALAGACAHGPPWLAGAGSGSRYDKEGDSQQKAGQVMVRNFFDAQVLRRAQGFTAVVAATDQSETHATQAYACQCESLSNWSQFINNPHCIIHRPERNYLRNDYRGS